MSRPSIAPKGEYEETGEFRAPLEGEFFWNEITGVVMVAGYGRSEKRKIMRVRFDELTEEKKEKSVSKETENGGMIRIDPDLVEAAKHASEILKDYLGGKVIAAEKVRIATQVLQTYSKLKTAETAERALIYGMLKDITGGDKEELRKLVGANIQRLK